MMSEYEACILFLTSVITSMTFITIKDRWLSNLTLNKSKEDGEQQIYKFVLTGGPCGGKTTALEKLNVFFHERGYRTFIVPEAATIGWTSGMSFDDIQRKRDCPLAFQQFVLKTQMTLEDCVTNFAKATKEKAIVICDRGTMDGSAYVDKETWLNVLDSCSLDRYYSR